MEILYLDWIDTNFQQTFNNRSNTVSFFKTIDIKLDATLSAIDYT